MMKRNILAVVIPALLVAGAANAAEIYNKDSNKLDLYGKVVGKHYFQHNGGNDNSTDESYARVGFKGETQINDQLTGYGQWEYNLTASGDEKAGQSQATRKAFAGLKFADFGSFDYGRSSGVFYDALAATDMFAEWGGESLSQTDNFMSGRSSGLATYRNTNFFGLVDGLALGLQYQGKNERSDLGRANGEGASYSLSYDFDGFGIAAAYSNSNRTHDQIADGKGKTAEGWATSLKYDANNLYAAVMYGESNNMTREEDGSFANKTQNYEAVVQYQFDFGLRPTLGYLQSKGKNLAARGTTFDGGNADLLKYVEAGAWYYFNKNMNVYAAYKFNLLDDNNYTRETGLATDDQFAVAITYQF